MFGSHRKACGHSSIGLFLPRFWSKSRWVKYAAHASSMNGSEYPLVPTRLYHHWWEVSCETRYSAYPRPRCGMPKTRSSIMMSPAHSLPFHPKYDSTTVNDGYGNG